MNIAPVNQLALLSSPSRWLSIGQTEVALASEGQYWETRLGRDFSLAGAGWAGLGLPFNAALYRQRAIVVARALRRYRIEPQGASVLELGPGTGFYVSLWKRLGVARLIGLDITNIAAERLAAAYPEFQFAVTDIGEGLPESLVPPGTFDIVTAFDVLFHIRDDSAFRRAIDGAAHALRMGGYFLVSDLFLHGEPIEGEHQKSRRLADYHAALTANGFRILDRLPVFVLMHPGYDLPPGHRRALALGWWKWLTRTLRAHPARARWLTPMLGLVDRMLTRVLREGPTTELLVAEKVSENEPG